MPTATGRPVVVSLCVPTYREHAYPNVAALGQRFNDALGGLAGELIVVLNGISAAKAEAPPFARLLDLGVNRGVPHAWNQAAAAARGEFLVFCNDDVLLGRDALRLLVEALQRHPDAGVVGPVGTLWDIEEGAHREYLSTAPGSPPGSVRDCDVVSGFLFATRARTYVDAGGFDEAYSPCGYEEVDYCTAVRLRLGHRCLAVEGVNYEHQFGISARRSWRRLSWSGGRESLGAISARNREYFRDKWRVAVR